MGSRLLRKLCCRCGEHKCSHNVIHPYDNRIVSIDRCLVPEVYSLWLKGVATIGCCCGHGEGNGYIQVIGADNAAMMELGYERIPPKLVDGALMGVNSFKPKTAFEFHGYDDAKTVLEDRFDSLDALVSDVEEKLQGIGDEESAKLLADRIREAHALIASGALDGRMYDGEVHI